MHLHKQLCTSCRTYIVQNIIRMTLYMHYPLYDVIVRTICVQCYHVIYGSVMCDICVIYMYYMFSFTVCHAPIIAHKFPHLHTYLQLTLSWCIFKLHWWLSINSINPHLALKYCSMVHNYSGCVVDRRRPCCQRRYLTVVGIVAHGCTKQPIFIIDCVLYGVCFSSGQFSITIARG